MVERPRTEEESRRLALVLLAVIMALELVQQVIAGGALGNTLRELKSGREVTYFRVAIAVVAAYSMYFAFTLGH